jgi:hypothetical protein
LICIGYRQMFSAEAVHGSTKYGCQGLTFDFNSMDLEEEVRENLSLMAEHSIARKTWNTYKSAERMLATFCKEKRKPLQLPVNESTILGFIHWLAFERGLSATSISGYLAGIRKLHIVKGLPEPTFRTRMVQMVLEGKKNLEAASRLREGPSRQPVTPDIIMLLKAKIREWEGANLSKLAIWAVCSLMFHGAFRGCELLSRTAAWFDPAYTLLRCNIAVVDDAEGKMVVQIKVKAPKEDKKGGVTIVDVFQTDTDMCPARAVKKWQKASRNMAEDQPAFRFDDGTPITSGKLNKLLKSWLGDTVSGIWTHSFRIGAASLMGKLGFSDKDVKAVGRWGSRAFEGYMRLPRTKRRLVAEKLAKYAK